VTDRRTDKQTNNKRTNSSIIT